MKNKLLYLVGLLVMVSCSCEKKRELPDVEPVALPRYNSGLRMSSKVLNMTVAYDILLPADYNTNTQKRYPVMYCFHGYGDNNTSWNGQWMSCESKIKSLEKAGLEPMIYVFPNGWNTYWVDRYDGKFPYMTMLATEFVPMIDNTYRTIPDREHRGTIGYSMGGFGAMVTAMQHPELFSMSAPLSMSFRTDRQYMGESQSGWDNQWGKIFGGVGQSGEGRLTQYYKSLCPLHQFTSQNHDKYSSVHWFITCGDNEEQLLIANDDLHVLMMDNGFLHEYRVGDGGHSSSYWRAALEEVLPFFSSKMAGQTHWQKTLKEIDDSQECPVDDLGVYKSSGYKSGEGTALYIAHYNMEESLLASTFSIIARGMTSKSFVLLPCDLSKKTLPEWITRYGAAYPVASSQALAVGEAGTSVLKAQERFAALYFENAKIEGTVTTSPDRFYFIGQCDTDRNYAGANALYKSCKETGAGFEYRCRNHLDNPREDYLTGIEYIKSNLYNF